MSCAYITEKGASQERTIPNACLSTRSGKECKAGLPMDTRLHLEHLVLLCTGLAKKRGLPWRGRRQPEPPRADTSPRRPPPPAAGRRSRNGACLRGRVLCCLGSRPPGFFGRHISVVAWRQPAALCVWSIPNRAYWSIGVSTICVGMYFFWPLLVGKSDYAVLVSYPRQSRPKFKTEVQSPSTRVSSVNVSAAI